MPYLLFVLIGVLCLATSAFAQNAEPRIFGAGEHRIDSAISLSDGETLRGAGMMATTLLASGNLEAIVRNSNQDDGNQSIVVEDLTIDCDGRADYGAFFVRARNLQLRNVAVRNCDRDGIRVSGRGVRTRGFLLDNVRAENNGVDGIIVMWAMRDGLYSNLYAEGNRRHGITFDHSEFTATNIVARGNNRSGVFLRNLFASTLNGLTSTHNGEHGVLVQGWVVSTGNAWRSQSNSKSSSSSFDDIFFSADSSLSYGATRDVSLNGVIVGDFAELDTTAHVRHGIKINPGVGSIQIDGAVYGDTRAQPFCRGCSANPTSAEADFKPEKEQSPPIQHGQEAPVSFLKLTPEQIEELRREIEGNNADLDQSDH